LTVIFIIKITPERLQRITSVLDRRQPDLTLITDEVHKQRNLAAIVRNCDAVGIDEIHSIVPSEAYQTYGELRPALKNGSKSIAMRISKSPLIYLESKVFRLFRLAWVTELSTTSPWTTLCPLRR